VNPCEKPLRKKSVYLSPLSKPRRRRENICICVGGAISINHSKMSKGMRKVSSWIEVAPAPIIFPKKPSNTPTLETITEEAAEEFEKDEISYNKRPSLCSN